MLVVFCSFLFPYLFLVLCKYALRAFSFQACLCLRCCTWALFHEALLRDDAMCQPRSTITHCPLPLVGSPLPKATWTKDGKAIPKVDVDQTPDFCKLKLKAVQRPDRGEYQLELVNDSGKETVPITLKVIGK